MSAASVPYLSQPLEPADRYGRLARALVVAFLAAGTVPMAAYAHATGDAAPLLAHLAALGAALLVAATRRAALRPARDWMPLALGPFLYVEMRWLIEGIGRPHADAVVRGWEGLLFPSDPSATWAPRAAHPGLSEALHFAYASYYLLVYVPPAILYLRGRRDAFAATLLALTLVYGICFAAYLVFPVDGPRYLVGPAAAPDGPVRTFVLHLLAAGSSRGTAFPSSHVAASVVASLCALRFQRPVGVVVSVLTAGLALGTVYGGFHYAVDALAGGIVGLAAWLLASALWRALSSPGAQSATAA
jgi:membrane-associated phospholipid phosphatase